ncbi:MAG: amidase, partial [Proteobacteria bacterium]|nr:amidase [Pseudomonadota bacterium]
MTDGAPQEMSADSGSDQVLCSMSVAQLRHAYVTGGLSPVAVTRAHLNRITRADPAYTTFVTVDTNGSVIRPAAFCGIVGFKPTFGRVSRAGVVPLASSLDHVGVLARSVEDAAMLMDTISTFSGHDLGSRPPRLPGVRVDAGRSSGLTLGIPSSMLVGLDPLIERAFNRAVKHLESAGISVRSVDLPIASVWTAVVSSVTMHAEGAVAHEQLVTGDPEEYGNDVLARLLSGLAISTSEYARAQTVRELIRNEVLSAMSGPTGVDAFIAPAVPDVAPFIQPGAFVPGDAPWHVGHSAFHLQRLPSLLGLPAGSGPVGWTPAGLPLPIQVFGRPWEDSKVLWMLGQAM